MTFEEWWLKEEPVLHQLFLDRMAEAQAVDFSCVPASLRYFMELAWLEGYAQGQMDSTPYQVP